MNTCEFCGNEYWVKPYRRAKTRFCSFQCSGAFRARETLNVGPKPWATANLNGHRHKSPTCFKPGLEPWNKGLKGIHLSPTSEWEKGDAPCKSVEIGTVTIRKDKSGKPRAFVKVMPGWEMRSRLAYSQANGPIPSNMVIHHIDGDTLNDALDNLAALTRAQHIAVHRADLFVSKPPIVAPVQESLI